jgi:dTDP-4-amino-4,6-dideoxygalactose transaminase
VAEAMFERYVSTPIHPRLTEEDVQYVVSSIRELA